MQGGRRQRAYFIRIIALLPEIGWITFSSAPVKIKRVHIVTTGNSILHGTCNGIHCYLKECTQYVCISTSQSTLGG